LQTRQTLKDNGLLKNILKAYKHTREAGTDVHEGVMLDSRFSPQLTQNEDNGQAIGICWKKSCATLSKSSDTVKIL